MATNLAPFNPTGAGAIQVAIRLLEPQQHDIVYDLGCGDARLLVAIAQHCHCKCIGIEYDINLVHRANELIASQGVQDHVTIHQQDATMTDFSDATILFLYLVPKGIQQLLPKLLQAKARGVRICTNIFSIPSWTPLATGDFKGTKIYLY